MKIIVKNSRSPNQDILFLISILLATQHETMSKQNCKNQNLNF